MVNSKKRSRLSASRFGWGGLAAIPLILGFTLRFYHLLQAEPFVDEPTTLLVAQAIARTGTPILPSGHFYGNDLVFSYLAGALVATLGANLAVIRAFSLAASLATIALVCVAGWRSFGFYAPESGGPADGEATPWIGLWSALLLALSPEAILWGARARAYALLQLVAFLAVWLFYLGVAAGRDGLRRLGWLLLVVAVYVHPEAGLLLPGLVVGAMLAGGWRWWFRPGRLIELLLAAAAVSSRFWWQTVLARGQIGQFDLPTGSRPPLQWVHDLPARVNSILPFFLQGERLAWTLLALLALVGAGWAVVRGRRRESWLPVLFFSACLWLVPVSMVLVLGDTYQSPRYLSMLLPIFALLAAWGLWLVVTGLFRLGARPRWRVALVGLATVVLTAASLPGAIAASNPQQQGFRAALEYVAARWQPGDRIATVAPAYSQTILGHCDYFTLGLDYEEFVYRADDGKWHDRWLGAPLIRSAAELAAVLDGGGRLWFVTDESRLRQRFDPAFAQLVWQRMELAIKTDQVLVFLSLDPPQPAAAHRLDTVLSKVALSCYELGLLAQQPADPGWGEVVAQAGQSLPLMLCWQAVEPIAINYTVFVHLLGPDGQRYAQADGPPLRGLQPMTHWLEGEILPDRRELQLPADLPPGRYRLEVGLYDPLSGDRLPVGDGLNETPLEALTLDYVRVLAADESLPSAPVQIGGDLSGDGDVLRLLGYSLSSDVSTPGGVLGLSLYWQALAPVRADYTVFVHLLAPDDQIWGQGDGPPLAGYYPTSLWDPGEIVVDERQVNIAANAPAGTYRLAVGLYLLPSGRRLATDDGDRLILGQVEIEP